MVQLYLFSPLHVDSKIVDASHIPKVLPTSPTSVGNIIWICRYQLHIGSEDIIIYAEGVRPYSLMVGHFTFYEEIGVQFPVGLEL